MSGFMILIILKNTLSLTDKQTKLYSWEANYKEKSVFLDRCLWDFPIHYFICSLNCI